MKTLFRLAILTLMLGGWAVAAASVYAIRTPRSAWPVVLVPRNHIACSVADFQDTYIDTDGWTLANAAEHPAMVTRLIQTGNTEYLRHVADPRSRQSLVAQLADAVQRGKAKQSGGVSVSVAFK